jgi:hypothetical protein
MACQWLAPPPTHCRHMVSLAQVRRPTGGRDIHSPNSKLRLAPHNQSAPVCRLPRSFFDMSLPQVPHDAARHRSPATAPDLAACRRGGCRVSRRPPPPQPCRATPPFACHEERSQGPSRRSTATRPLLVAHFETRLRAVVPLFNTLAGDFTNGKPQPMWPCVRHALTAFED